MKSFKQIALGAILAVSSVGAITYTSCTKDKCKDVVCQHNGVCTDGNCTCPIGTTGSSCETVYRDSYLNTYKGNGIDNDGLTYTNHTLSFTAGSDTSYTKMQMEWKTSTGTSVYSLPVMITPATGTSIISIVSTTKDGYVLSGTGTISATSVTMAITETPSAGGAATIYTFTNMLKQ